MANKIFLRADGGGTVGYGHLVRCMALAHMLKEDFSICFVCRRIPQSIMDDMHQVGFAVEQIHSEGEFFEMLHGDEIVVLDHYGLGSEYQEKVKEKGSKLVCIDDFHNQKFFADLIINHAPGITPKEYDAEPYTDFALGFGYALLRPAFLEAARRPPLAQDSTKVFICFGGADPDNLTYRSIITVSKLDQFNAISVVAGGAFKIDDELEALLDNDQRIKIYSGLSENGMRELMEASGLAIVPSSSVLLEALACGLNTITCYYADNQKDFHDRIVSRGVTSIGAADLKFEENLLKAVQEYRPSADLAETRQQLYGIRANHLSKFKSLQYGKI